jgi:hypothetical protein
MSRFASLITICALLLAIQPLVVKSLADASDSPEYPVRPALEYAKKAIRPGLVVALEPLENIEQQKRYFNASLSSRGILPVLIVIQNTSPTETYFFDKSGIGLAEAVGATGEHSLKAANVLNSGGLVDITLIRIGALRIAMSKREVRSRTLTPSSSVSGFFYVPVPADAPRKEMHLQVPLTSAQTGETQVINLFF